MTGIVVKWAAPTVDKDNNTIVMLHIGKPADESDKDVLSADEVLTPAHRAALLDWLGLAGNRYGRAMNDVMRESAGETIPLEDR